MEEKEVLHVHMLGGFSLRYGDRPISFDRSSTTKTIQLLQMILHAGEKGVAREALLEALYGRDDITNPGATLRVNIFRLRKFLNSAGLPKGEYIIIKSGIYRWDSENFPLEVDAQEFRKYALAALNASDEEQGIHFMKLACSSYRGEFLPMIAGEEWVAIESANYQQLYFKCLRKLCPILKERREYESLLEISSAAAAMYPFEEWQLIQMDCLMALNRAQEAMKVYESTSNLFFEELGLSPSPEMLERFHTMSGRIEYEASTLSDIQAGLREEKRAAGAYYCSYPGFMDTYRIVSRMIERTGQSVFLMLCTLTDLAGNPIEKEDALEEYTGRMQEAIRRALRRGDSYTKYSPNQFLVLLMGIKQEDCPITQLRINNCFKNGENRLKVKIRYAVKSVAEVQEPAQDAPVIQFSGKGPSWN